MNISQDQLNQFAEFGRQRLAAGEPVTSLDELVVEWESLQQRQDVNAAIREGLADADAGRHRPADVVLAELVQKHGLAPQ